MLVDVTQLRPLGMGLFRVDRRHHDLRNNLLIYTRLLTTDKKYTITVSHMSSREEERPWHFLTNHAQVLLAIADDPDTRLRDVAQIVGITERAAQRIVADLVETSYVVRERVGRRNRYRINREAKMRHEAQLGKEIGPLLDLFATEG